MSLKNTKYFADERLVPEMVPWHQQQMINDHIARYHFACKQIDKSKAVVDIACGSGYGTKLLHQISRYTYGIDIDSEAVRYARRKYSAKRILYINGTAIHIPIKSQTIDYVVSFETLEHVSDQNTFIAEVVRILKPKGIFIVSTPNILVNGGEANPYHLKELSLDEFTSSLKSQFDVVDLYGQKAMHQKYLEFVVWLTQKIPAGALRWFIDSALKMVFRGTQVKPIENFKHGYVPAFFIAVCKK